MAWQLEQADSGDEPVGQPGPLAAAGLEDRPARRHRRAWAAMVLVLAIALCGLAVGAAGAARQLLPRQFSAAQEQRIMTWEMSRRWRAMAAGQIFPAAVSYQVPPQVLQSSESLSLTARRLGIAPLAGCAAGVSAAAAAVLAAGHCAAVLRATYVDASQSMVVTLGVAALPDAAAAAMAAKGLSAAAGDQWLAVHALAVAGTPAARFHDGQRQLSVAIGAGPYVILATAGFSDSRRHVQLSADAYIDQEMNSLADGLADSAVARLGGRPPVPRCPGAPGC